jgi:hypothetical protein
VELRRRLDAMRAAEKSTAEDGVFLRRLAEQEKVLPAVAKDAKETPKPLSPEELETLLLAKIAIGEAELGDLARRRGDGARGYLVAEGRLTPERVTLAEKAAGAAGASRVSFALR